MKFNFEKLAKELGETLEHKQLMLVTAESCTGGMVAEVVTLVSGSASWFERGFVTYSNQAKHEMLAVSAETIEEYGAVSEQTATAMAQGALNHSHASVSVAVTGIAGPTGGTDEKPVGTVCFAWAFKDGFLKSEQNHFDGDRNNIRSQATQYVLQQLIAFL